jgi:hypothetical protein
VAWRDGGVAAPADAPWRQLLVLLLGLDVALLLLHLGTEGSLAVLGAGPAASADRALLGAAAPLQLLAFAALAVGTRANGLPPDRPATVAAVVLALADATSLPSRLATAVVELGASPALLPVAKLATAGAVATLVLALLLRRPGRGGPLGRIVLRLTLGLGTVAVLLDAAAPLTLRGVLPRSILDGLEELAEAAVASWALAAGCRVLLRPASLSRYGRTNPRQTCASALGM